MNTTEFEKLAATIVTAKLDEYQRKQLAMLLIATTLNPLSAAWVLSMIEEVG